MIRIIPWPAVLAAGLLAAAVIGVAPKSAAGNAGPSAPRYDASGRLMVPRDYREWVFLSAGIDMRYGAGTAPSTDHVFSNVFVPQAAYRAFQATGTWPDHTVLILENRTASTKGSINKAGHFQGGRLGLEAHVKDVARFSGGWGFFAFDGEQPSERIDDKADCYSCHRANAAVDTSFVQFYPTLLPTATRRGTLSRPYLVHEQQDAAANRIQAAGQYNRARP